MKVSCNFLNFEILKKKQINFTPRYLNNNPNYNVSISSSFTLISSINN